MRGPLNRGPLEIPMRYTASLIQIAIQFARLFAPQSVTMSGYSTRLVACGCIAYLSCSYYGMSYYTLLSYTMLSWCSTVTTLSLYVMSCHMLSHITRLVACGCAGQSLSLSIYICVLYIYIYIYICVRYLRGWLRLGWLTNASNYR